MPISHTSPQSCFPSSELYIHLYFDSASASPRDPFSRLSISTVSKPISCLEGRIQLPSPPNIKLPGSSILLSVHSIRSSHLHVESVYDARLLARLQTTYGPPDKSPRAPKIPFTPRP
ncbi:hypothetical protein QCA50_019105 [Cerrena zonata]|uniref:Uncharacterized protein n=1 Tax=Cerrena zonata TaxID=2478898 RepID=A0AAW0FFQ2_9APHY